jgi:NAD(P)-dependent dehydrogenase (short-subunit alcohol dehydrogenase family)
VTGAASGIGFALAERFARSGLDVVLADIEKEPLSAATQKINDMGVSAIGMPTDVSDEAAMQSLAAATVERFGAVHVVCNNAGVASFADPWSGPMSAWGWVFGVNVFGVVHGIRAFLPFLREQGEGHIVNTASTAGLKPGGIGPIYPATKHAVVAISEDLYNELRAAQQSIGISVLCPGAVRTNVWEADRNWPQSFGDPPPPGANMEVLRSFGRNINAGGLDPPVVADLVADAICANRFWIFTHPELMDGALRRWQSIAAGENPRPFTGN